VETSSIKAIDYLLGFPRTWLPPSTERRGKPSNGELRRWLRNQAVIINGLTPQPLDDVSLPITELIFFPKGKRRATLWKQ